MRLPLVLGTIAALLLPWRAHAQQLPAHVTVSTRTLSAAVQQLQQGGTYSSAQLIAQDLNDQAGASVQQQAQEAAQKAAADKAAADAQAQAIAAAVAKQKADDEKAAPPTPAAGAKP
jgi:hypothetical protein